MHKYGDITATGGTGLISLMNIVACYLDVADDIVIDYDNGSQVKLASAAALVQADVNKVFEVIKNAQEQKWSKV